VAAEPLDGGAVAGLVVLVEVPEDEGLVPGGGDQHLAVLGVGGHLGDPAAVPAEGVGELHRFGHF